MNKVFVGSLSWNTREEDLRDFFSQIGEIQEVKIVTDRETGRARGFGFVTFTNPEDANTAVERLDGSELDGRTLKVNMAQERRRDGAGGGSGSRSGGARFGGSAPRW